MSAADWAQVGIAAATLIAALGAVSTALLNYRTRPLLIRTREVHSDDLKNVLREWKAALPNCLLNLYVPATGVRDLELHVESLVLFADLPKHIPSGVNAFQRWNDFKKQRKDFCVISDRLTKGIRDYLATYGRLAVQSGGVDAVGFSEACQGWLYRAAVLVAEGRGVTLDQAFRINQAREGGLFILVHGAEVVARTDSALGAKFAQEFLESTVSEIGREADTSATHQLVLAARELVSCHERLRDLDRNLVGAIETVLAVPILTGDCEHIRRATDSFWPSWLRRAWRWLSESTVEE